MKSNYKSLEIDALRQHYTDVETALNDYLRFYGYLAAKILLQFCYNLDTYKINRNRLCWYN